MEVTKLGFINLGKSAHTIVRYNRRIGYVFGTPGLSENDEFWMILIVGKLQLKVNLSFWKITFN